jgi:hypothetical protein
MKYTYYHNPLRTRVYLDEHEKEILRLKYKEDYLKEIIFGVKYHLEKNPTEVIECPNPHMNGKTNWQLAKDEIPENIYSEEFNKRLIERADEMINELENGYHVGDCTCVPCSCFKCAAEYTMDIDTIKGLGKHEAAMIGSYFSPHHDFDERTIDDVLEKLKNYEPVKGPAWDRYTQEEFDKHVPRWKQEAQNAYKWLLNYKNEHGF